MTSWDRPRLASIPMGPMRAVAATALAADDDVLAVIIHGRAGPTVEIKGGDIQRVQSAVTAEHPALNAIVVEYREALT